MKAPLSRKTTKGKSLCGEVLEDEGFAWWTRSGLFQVLEDEGFAWWTRSGLFQVLEDEGFCLVDKVRSFSGLLALS